MSSYGPTGRPGRDQPQDPYDQPADPWGNPERRDEESRPGSPATPSGYGGPAYGQPGYDPPGYEERGYDGFGAAHGQPAYGQPAYGQTGYGQNGYNQPGYGQSGYAGPGYGQPGYAGPAYGGGYGPGQDGNGPGRDGYPEVGHEPEPPKRSSTRLIVSVVVVLAVLVLGGAATLFYLNSRDHDPAASPPGNHATNQAGGAQTGGPQAGGGQGDATAPAGQDPGAATGQSGTPAPESSAEARFATKGQCLVNDGTNEVPRMRIVACGPNTYEVLARFDATIDYQTECGKVKGYQFHYFFDSELNALDFVLCLKKR
jgi:hypothetical protein